MKKKIEIIVEDFCENCPFCEYDSYYSRSTDSGYDCKKTGNRLADDNRIASYNKKLKEIEEQNKTLFKYNGEIPKDPLLIPDNCPLPNEI